MIKVNLLKNRGTVTEAGTQFDFNASTDFNTEKTGAKPVDSLAKIAIIFAFPLLLWIYESYNIGQLTAQYTSLQRSQNDLQTEITKNQPIIAKATKMQTEIKELEDRIQIIKNLSKIRLREIKAIDFLQNVMPEKVWFKELEFKDSTFRVTGFAVTNDSLNKFIEAIDGKSYFRNVILMQSSDQKTPNGTIKSFSIGSNLVDSD